MVNKVTLLGRIGQDPEVKHLEGDKVVAKVSLATSESYKDKSRNKVENTEWHNLELWDGLAKIAESYLKKGSQIYVEGKIKTDKWETDTGEKRSAVKIRVTSLTMLGGNQSQEPHVSTQPQPQQEPETNVTQKEEDDLPF